MNADWAKTLNNVLGRPVTTKWPMTSQGAVLSELAAIAEPADVRRAVSAMLVSETGFTQVLAFLVCWA